GSTYGSFYDYNTGAVFVISTTSATSNSITFPLPATLPANFYGVKARNSIGESNAINHTVYLSGGTQSQTVGSTAGGFITFSSISGFPPSLPDPNFSFNLTSGTNVYVPQLTLSGQTLTVFIPPGIDTQIYDISFISPVNTVTKTYTLSQYATPLVTLTSAATVNSGSNTITFTVSNLQSGEVVTGITLVSTQNSSNTITVSNWTFVSTAYTFAATLTSGQFTIQVTGSKSGFFNSPHPLSVSLAAVSAPNKVLGYSGGQITITGNNLSPTSYITVNGLRGDILTYSNSSVTYNVPALVTATSQAALNLAQVTQLNVN
ncbi:unnamed protein product, partial [Sphagnum balticum]